MLLQFRQAQELWKHLLVMLSKNMSVQMLSQGYPPSSTLLACSNAVADRGNEPLLTSSFCLCLGQSTDLALLIQFLAVSACSATKPLTTCKLLSSGTGMHHLGTFLQTISSWHSAQNIWAQQTDLDVSSGPPEQQRIQ